MTTVPVDEYLERVEALGPLIQENVAWSQSERRLAPAVVEAFHDNGLFRILVAREFNGGGLKEVEAVSVIEALAAIDASAAWNVMIAASSAGYVRALKPEAAAEILTPPRSLVAGVVNPHAIRLREVDGGYIVSGKAPFASGCSQATWFGAGGLAGSELMISVMPASQGQILDTWKVTGLRGTGSHDILFEDVFVPAKWVGNNRNVPATRAGATIAAVAVGTARHALAELGPLVASKLSFGSRTMVRDRADVQISVARATGLIEAAHSLLVTLLGDLPDRTPGGELHTAKEEALLRMSCVMATELAVEAVDLIHSAAGTSALHEESLIGLCWRDIHAVQQNLSVQPRHYQPIGEVLLSTANC